MKIYNEYEEVKKILIKHDSLHKDIDELDLGSGLYDDLFGYYFSSGDMPYGVLKARTGMPDEWIMDRLFELELVYDQEKVDDYNNDYAQRKAY